MAAARLGFQRFGEARESEEEREGDLVAFRRRSRGVFSVSRARAGGGNDDVQEASTQELCVSAKKRK
jgi:hypothetical protein